VARREKPIPERLTGLLPIGSRLRQARRDAHVSLTELARRLNYTKGYLSAVENGHSKPSPELLTHYARALSVERSALVDYSGVAPIRDRISSTTDGQPPDDTAALTHARMQLIRILILCQYKRRQDNERLWGELRALIDQVSLDQTIDGEDAECIVEFLKAGLSALARRSRGKL
jgi:transcriptional regulator with XRE-family HTH domain